LNGISSTALARISDVRRCLPIAQLQRTEFYHRTVVLECKIVCLDHGFATGTAGERLPGSHPPIGWFPGSLELIGQSPARLHPPPLQAGQRPRFDSLRQHQPRHRLPQDARGHAQVGTPRRYPVQGPRVTALTQNSRIALYHSRKLVKKG
jgi:hypothetical protein